MARVMGPTTAPEQLRWLEDRPHRWTFAQPPQRDELAALNSGRRRRSSPSRAPELRRDDVPERVRGEVAEVESDQWPSCSTPSTTSTG
jgi:hypothetical protein